MATGSCAGAGRAVIVALVLVLTACSGDGPPERPEGSDASGGSGPATALDGCPPPTESGDPDPAFDQPYADLPPAVPEDAVAARICAGGGITSQVPADILTTSVDVLVDAVNALPEQERGFCPADLGPGYRILFDYADGSTFLISAHYAGCEDVVVGSGTREHPRSPARTFIDLLRAQRAGGRRPTCRRILRTCGATRGSSTPSRPSAEPPTSPPPLSVSTSTPARHSTAAPASPRASWRKSSTSSPAPNRGPGSSRVTTNRESAPGS
jgi:hypothetical protein